MERVTFLIERTGERISCLLNPESLEARRSAGLARRRLATGGVLGNPRSDDPLIPTGGGITEYDLQLLFDVDVANEGRRSNPPALPPIQSLPIEEAAQVDVLPDPPIPPEPAVPSEPEPDDAIAVALADDGGAAPEPASTDTVTEAAPEPDPPAVPALPAILPSRPEDPALVRDVRELTQPLWALAETGEPVDGALIAQRVRFVWGKSWNVPGVVLAVAERLEYFDIDGVPRRSWLSLRLRRVEEDAENGGAAPPPQPSNPQFLIDQSGDFGSPANQDSIAVPVNEAGDVLLRYDQLGADLYGDPALGRALFAANDCPSLLELPEGFRLRMQPRATLAAQG